MNDFPRQALRQILAKYGKEIAGNAQRCNGLLNDLCSAYRREINILVTAIEERIPLDLLASARSMPTEVLLTRLEKRLADQTGLTAEAARWAVESWALALDVATDSQIAQRALKQNDYPAEESAKIPPINDKSTNQDFPQINSARHESQRKTQTNQPPTKTAPPANKQPTKLPLPSSSPAPVPTNNQPTIQPTGTTHPSTANQPVGSNTRFRLFRGCLIFLFILIVSGVLLVFVAPYALEQMRETQREKQNEPPRFPVR